MTGRRKHVWLRGTLAAALAWTAFPGYSAAETVVESADKKVEWRAASESSSSPTMPAAAAAVSEPNVSRERAIEIAMKAAGKLDGYSGPEVSRRNEPYGPYDSDDVWEIRWRKEGPQFEYINVSVAADTGLVLRLDVSGSDRDGKVKFPPKVKYEDAVKLAEAYVSRIYGEAADDFQYDDRQGEDWGKMIRTPQDTYEIRFTRLQDGIPFPHSSISVRVNGNGELRGLYYSPVDNVRFASPQGVLSKEDVLARLNRDLRMKLAYQQVYTGFSGQERPPKVFLAYQPELPMNWVDAKTGNVLDYSGKPAKESQAADSPVADSAAAAPPAKLAAPLTQQQIIQRLSSMVELPADVTISSVESEDGPERKIWRVMFEYRYRNGGMGWTGGEIDAETGEILRVDITPYLREKTGRNDGEKGAAEQQGTASGDPAAFERAKEAALQFVRQYSKDKLHQLYLSYPLQETPDPVFPVYRFQFERRIGGIPVSFNYVAVSVSAESGKVVEFHQNWNHQLEVPEPQNAIGPDEAKTLFLNHIDLRMEYRIMDEKSVYERNRAAGGDKKPEPLQAALIYRIVPKDNKPYFIDTLTGKLRDPGTGEEWTETSGQQGITDIQGHWAEKQLQYMLDLKVIEAKNGRVNPDEAINRGQFMQMMFKLFNGSFPGPFAGREEASPSFDDVPKNNEYYAAIEWGVRIGLLDKGGAFRPDDPMIREEAADLFVKAMGYNKLAEKDGVFQLDFSDKNQIDYPGQVAIVHAMGIMLGDGTRFYPDEPLTRAQAAVVLFRFMENWQEYKPDVSLN